MPALASLLFFEKSLYAGDYAPTFRNRDRKGAGREVRCSRVKSQGVSSCNFDTWYTGRGKWGTW